MTRCRVKICGITHREDAEAAVEAGADALGFVFYAPSPRNVEVEAAARLVAALPPFVTPVGVFVDRPGEEIREICRRTGCSVAQIHGAITPELIVNLRRELRVIAALRLTGPEDLPRWRRLGAADAFLFDTHVPGALPGGTGRSFPWEWLSTEDRPARTILAGGLQPENVAEAIARARPFAVDVSSGVEATPGRKSLERIQAFLTAVRSSG